MAEYGYGTNGGGTNGGGTNGSDKPVPNLPPPPPPPETLIVPQQGDVVRGQQQGIGRFGRQLIPVELDLSAVRSALDAKLFPYPAHSISIIKVFGGAIPEDARMAIGDSAFFPLVEGLSYTNQLPFAGFTAYWPTAAAGVKVWILLAFGRLTLAD